MGRLFHDWSLGDALLVAAAVSRGSSREPGCRARQALPPRIAPGVVKMQVDAWHRRLPHHIGWEHHAPLAFAAAPERPDDFSRYQGRRRSNAATTERAIRFSGRLGR